MNILSIYTVCIFIAQKRMTQASLPQCLLYNATCSSLVLVEGRVPVQRGSNGIFGGSIYKQALDLTYLTLADQSYHALQANFYEI